MAAEKPRKKELQQILREKPGNWRRGAAGGGKCYLCELMWVGAQETIEGQQRFSFLREGRLMPRNNVRLGAPVLLGSSLGSGLNTITPSKNFVFLLSPCGIGQM